MTTQKATEFAARLHGREIGAEITRMEIKEARDQGLLVVYGASDDLVELAGLITQEIGSYGGVTFRPTVRGVMCEADRDAREELKRYGMLEHYEAKLAAAPTVVATYGKDPEVAWMFETPIPHATFDIMEDGEVFCRGLVIDVADLT